MTRFYVESLEDRRLLSVSIAGAMNASAVGGSVVTASSPFGSDAGFTLHETAGVPFTAKIAFYPTPVLDPPLAYSASINWGDGTVTAGKWVYGQNGSDFGLVVSGSHQYTKAGTFTIKTQIIEGPLPGSGLMIPSQVVDTITSSAIVAARPANTANGRTIVASAGKFFMHTLGTFSFPTPGNGLFASVNWGDGTSSAGTIKAIGVSGVDVINFSVVGSHTYKLPGTYPIQVTVTRVVGETFAPVIISSIHSTAKVYLPLAGTISGTYSIAPTTNPDAGKLYLFNGAGTAGMLGQVTAAGSIRTLGFVATGQATGTLTLSNSQGSVTLKMIGPSQPGFSNLPATLTYQITAATGAYYGDQGTGTIAVSLLSPAANLKKFTFVIS
jgi:hypothetical protein